MHRTHCWLKKNYYLPTMAVFQMRISNMADWSSCLPLLMSYKWLIYVLAELHPKHGGVGHGRVPGDFEEVQYSRLSFSEQHSSERKKMHSFSLISIIVNACFFLFKEYLNINKFEYWLCLKMLLFFLFLKVAYNDKIRLFFDSSSSRTQPAEKWQVIWFIPIHFWKQ